LSLAWPEATIVGCSAGGVLGGGREVENCTALAVTAAHLPDVGIVGFHRPAEDPATIEESAAWWPTHLGVQAEHQPIIVVFPEPFTTHPVQLLAGLDRAYPGRVKLGGLASGGTEPGTHRLLLDDGVHLSGAVGVALYGDIEADTVVAQGCRPVGEPLVVSQCRKNVLLELSGAPALGQLERIFEGLSQADQARFRALPVVGMGMDPDRRNFGQGDFLIRHLTGMDRDHGALAVGAVPAEGQVVQFHIRDAEASRADLEALLTAHVRTQGDVSTEGALMFSCLGRGQRFFGVADHDTDLFVQHVGAVPLGGFFCAGEIGPLNGQTWLHGYTSAFGLFRPRGWS
jgi:small ligand-binding sensory domain FIST